jgi:hypothetical protein
MKALPRLHRLIVQDTARASFFDAENEPLRSRTIFSRRSEADKRSPGTAPTASGGLGNVEDPLRRGVTYHQCKSSRRAGQHRTIPSRNNCRPCGCTARSQGDAPARWGYARGSEKGCFGPVLTAAAVCIAIIFSKASSCCDFTPPAL